MKKTNSVADILKAKGIKLGLPSSPVEVKKGTELPKFIISKRRRIYEQSEDKGALEDNKNQLLNQLGTSYDLDTNQLGTSYDLDTNQLGTSYDLDTNQLGTSSKISETERIKYLTSSETSSYLVQTLTQIPLRGAPRLILDYFSKLCLREGGLTTPRLPGNTFQDVLKIPLESARTAIKRLKKERHITHVTFERGRDGWTCYTLHQTSYKQLIKEIESGFEPVRNQLGTSSQTSSNSPSSSILSYSLDLKENTNTSEAEIPTESDKQENGPDPIWGEIDFSGLVEINFTKYHLRQWRDRKYCSPQEAQESIWHFEYDYRHHFRADSKKKALTILMGTVAKSKYYARPDGYRSPEEIAQQIRLESEERRADEQELILKKLFEAKFEIWFNSQTGNTIKALTHGVSSFEARKTLARQKFQDEHWFTVRDNPDVDPTNLTIQLPEIMLTHPEPAQNQSLIGLPVKQFSELDLAEDRCASELEAIRQLEKVIENEPKESLKTTFRSQISSHEKKLEKLFTEFPELREEKRLIDEAMESLGKSNP